MNVFQCGCGWVYEYEPHDWMHADDEIAEHQRVCLVPVQQSVETVIA